MISPAHILQKYWGHSSFRDSQEDVIEAVLDKKDVVTILPTGGGKSVCYQVPGLILEGVCLVISCLLYTSPSPRDRQKSRMPSSA